MTVDLKKSADYFDKPSSIQTLEFFQILCLGFGEG